MSQSAPPIGMVDQLAPTPRANSLFEQAVLSFVLHAGAGDTAIHAQVSDPQTRADYAKAELAQRALDWPHLGMYRGENARQARRPRVVFMGDSITEMWTHGDPSLFGEDILGRGISGQTSPQMLVRFYADVVQLKPAAVHILCGGNDIAGNTGPTTPQDFKNNLLAMLDLAQHNGIAVLLGSILPATRFTHSPQVEPAARIAALNDWLATLAAARGLVYIDYYSALAAEDGAMRAPFTNDGVHPNAAGYAAMRPLARAALDAVPPPT